ncbi:MAG TPA: MerR family transcriptional regulator [Lactobacillaceae bacterium]|jgi:DNA-binding transcriptional MerR regulator
MATITEISQATGFSIHTLRYYEQVGLLSVARTAGGHRDYTEENRLRLIAIKHYRNAGISLEQIKTIFQQDDHNAKLVLFHERKKALQEELEALQETIRYLDYKIDYFTNKQLSD